jgi:membrane protease subunit HflK
MERILRNSSKVIVDGKGGTAPIVLPPDLLRPQRSATAPPVVVQAQPQAPAQGAAQ